MAKFQEYQFRTTTQLGAANTAVAETWQTVSDTLAGFASQVRQATDKHEAAQDKAMLDQIGVDAMKSAIQTAETVGADYERFQLEEENETKRILENVPSHLQAEAKNKIALQFAQKGQPVYKKFYQAQNAKEIIQSEQDVEMMGQNIVAQTNEYIDLYKSGDIFVLSDNEFDAMVGGIQMDTFEMYNKIDEMVIKNGYSAEKADKLKSDTRMNIMSGVLREELNQANKTGKGNEMMLSFLYNPDKHIKKDYMQTLFPGETFSDDDRDELSDRLVDHLKDVQNFESEQREQFEREQEDKWDMQYSLLMQSLADDPTSVSTDFVKTLLRGGALDYSRHDSLIDQIESGKFYKDDPIFMYELNLKMDDPTYNVNTLRREIVTQKGKLTPGTLGRYLDDLRTRGTARFQEPQNQALREAQTEFAPSGPAALLMPDQADKINKMRREIYSIDAQSEAEFYEKWDAIKARYKSNQSREEASKLIWYPTFIGNPKEPDIESSKVSLLKEKTAGTITEQDYIKQLNMLQRWEAKAAR